MHTVLHCFPREAAHLSTAVVKHGGCGPKTQVGLHFGHRQAHRPVALHLQDKGPVELDVRLHEHRRGHHLTQQAAHRFRIGARLRLSPTLEQVLPGIGQADQHAPNR